jgi:hypothetical protein
VDSGYYAACTALKTQSSALELIANNVANINTTGYRAQLPSFESLLVEGRNSTQSNGWSRLVNQFAVLDGARLDLTEGNLQRTGNPLDLALDGPGFFAVQTKAGVLYTRDGNFRLSAKGQLTTASGDAVLGAAGPINVPGNEQIAIGPDGTIFIGRRSHRQIAPGGVSPGRPAHCSRWAILFRGGDGCDSGGAYQHTSWNAGVIECEPGSRGGCADYRAAPGGDGRPCDERVLYRLQSHRRG